MLHYEQQFIYIILLSINKYTGAMMESTLELLLQSLMRLILRPQFNFGYACVYF